MGQSVSKWTTKLSSTITTKSNMNNIMIPTKKGGITSADPITGFHRGNVWHPQDVMQNQFNKERQEGKANSEMPNDLLQFMKDVGPVNRSEVLYSSGSVVSSSTKLNNTEIKHNDLTNFMGNLSSSTSTTTTTMNNTTTSSNDNNDIVPSLTKPLRVPRHLRTQWEQEQQQTTTDNTTNTTNESPFHDNTRIVSSMRLAKNVDGHFTNRTTSFSYDNDIESLKKTDNNRIDSKDYGLNITQLYQLLSSTTISANSDDVNSTSTANHFYKQTVHHHVDNDIHHRSEEIKQKQQEKQSKVDHMNINLLQNALRYYEIPIIMKDTDDTYVGTSIHNVSLLEKQMKLINMPKTVVKLVLNDIIDSTTTTTTTTTMSASTTNNDSNHTKSTTLLSSSSSS